MHTFPALRQEPYATKFLRIKIFSSVHQIKPGSYTKAVSTGHEPALAEHQPFKQPRRTPLPLGTCTSVCRCRFMGEPSSTGLLPGEHSRAPARTPSSSAWKSPQRLPAQRPRLFPELRRSRDSGVQLHEPSWSRDGRTERETSAAAKSHVPAWCSLSCQPQLKPRLGWAAEPSHHSGGICSLLGSHRSLLTPSLCRSQAKEHADSWRGGRGEASPWPLWDTGCWLGEQCASRGRADAPCQRPGEDSSIPPPALTGAARQQQLPEWQKKQEPRELSEQR